MCNDLHMATNLAINEELLEEALYLGGHKTKRDTVNEALAEYIRRRKRKRILDFFGKLEWDTQYDYKSMRHRV